MNQDPNNQPLAPSTPSPAPQPMPQPQPVPQPMPMAAPPAPMAPPQPVSAYPGQSMPPYTHAGSKGRMWAIIGGIIGGVVLIVIIAIVAMFSIFTVSTDDYQESYDAASSLRDAIYDQSSVYVSSYATETELKNDTEKVKSAYSEAVAAYSTLYDTKAVKRDSDAKAKLEAINQKFSHYLAYSDAEVEALEEIMPVAVSLNDMSSSSSLNYDSLLSNIQGIRDTMDDLDLVESVNTDYRDQLVKTLDEFIVALKAYIAMHTKGDYSSATTSQYYDSLDKINEVEKDWRSNLEKLADEGDISDELNDLGNYLTTKANGL